MMRVVKIKCEKCGKEFKVCSKLANTSVCASCIYVANRGRVPLGSTWQLCFYCPYDRICSK
jgi:hypothetical protein